MSKISLKLDEANDLKFQFRVQGTSSEPGATAPQFRFVVCEKNNPSAVGFVFPVVAKESDGTISVAVPPLNEMVREGVAYTGKVEVLVGSRLLTPTVLEVNFTRSLSVEVVPILPEESSVDSGDKVGVEDMLAELEEQQQNHTTPEPSTIAETGKKQITLTKSQLAKMIQERALQKKQAGLQAKPASSSSLKESLKDMMKSALQDD